MTVAVLAGGPGAAVRAPSLLPVVAPAAGVRRNALADEERNATDSTRCGGWRQPGAKIAGRLRRPGAGLRRDAIRRNRRAPYVNSADQSEAVPFLDIGDRYILAGAQYDAQVLASLSQAQIASQLRNPDNPVAKALDGSANVVIAAIGSVLHHQADS